MIVLVGYLLIFYNRKLKTKTEWLSVFGSALFYGGSNPPDPIGSSRFEPCCGSKITFGLWVVTALNESDTEVSARYFIARWSRGLGRLVFIQKDIGSNPIRVTLITIGQVVVGKGDLNEGNEMMVKLLPGRVFSILHRPVNASTN